MNERNDGKTKRFVTNLKPPTMIIVDGPCEIYMQKINEHGQVEFCFMVDRKVTVETIKMRKDKE